MKKNKTTVFNPLSALPVYFCRIRVKRPFLKIEGLALIRGGGGRPEALI